jgi:transketolase
MHGEAMGDADIAVARRTLGWSSPPFEIPADIRAAWDRREKGAAAEREWRTRFSAYRQEFPALAAEFERRMAGDLPSGFDELLRAFAGGAQSEGKSLATRQSSQAALNAIGPSLPELLGGSADLTPSNGTWRKDSVTLSPTAPAGNYIHYGVREFGMSAVMNGITAHGGLIPYGGTFLTFSDYARNAVRMACLMRIRVIFVYTHDSIGLGEDGPTHQPIEHLASLRVIPHIDLWRPCDAVETAVAWGVALDSRDGPTLLVLTRQACTHQAREPGQVANIARGGYVLIESSGAPEAIVIATGSEVGIAAEAVRSMNAKGRKVRLVSMPSTNRYDAQDAAYKESVLPAAVTRRVAVEAGVRADWWRYVGLKGQVVGIDHFGASAPAKVLFPQFGFTAEKVIEAVEKTAGG